MEIVGVILEYLTAPMMCVLQHLPVLIWPGIVIYFLVKYRRQIDRLVARIAEESEWISVAGLADLKLPPPRGKNVERAAEDLPREYREPIQDALKADNALEQFRFVCSYFYGHPHAVREEAAAQAASLAGELTLDDLLAFCTSGVRGGEVRRGNWPACKDRGDTVHRSRGTGGHWHPTPVTRRGVSRQIQSSIGGWREFTPGPVSP